MDTSKKSGSQFPVWFGIDVSKDSFTAACIISRVSPTESRF